MYIASFGSIKKECTIHGGEGERKKKIYMSGIRTSETRVPCPGENCPRLGKGKGGKEEESPKQNSSFHYQVPTL